MPTQYIDFIPPDIPGLKFNQTTPTGGNVSGSSDALSVLGIEPLPQTMKSIAWPNHIPGYEFQKEGNSRLQNILNMHGGALLADDMGLGKTRSASVVAHAMNKIGTTMVVCPAGVRHQWAAELNTLEQGPVMANLGPQSKKEYTPDWERWSKGTLRYCAVSYNLMGKALECRRPDFLILDEPHNFLQGRGNTYNKVLWKHRAVIRYKLALTGTPYLAHPSGLWSILFILFGMRFGKARDYDVRYCAGHQGQWGWRNDGASNMDELNQRLKHYTVRRMKSEALKDMPAVTRVVRWVEGTKKAANALAMMDHSLNGMQKAEECTLEDKFSEVIDVVSNSTSPVVVFTRLRNHCTAISDLLNKAKRPAIAIHGEWEAGERAKMIAFAKANSFHVVTTYGASSTGLDGLQHFSSNFVAHSINGVPAITLQAIDRLNRIGQKEPVTATFVAMKNSVDELIVDKVINRLDIFGQILGRDKAAISLSDALRSSGLTEEEELDAVFKSLT